MLKGAVTRYKEFRSFEEFVSRGAQIWAMPRSNVQIAHALATTSNAINVALHRARKNAKGAKKTKPGKRA